MQLRPVLRALALAFLVAAPVLAHLADTGMRFDIALVGGFGLVGVLAHDVGGGKARLQLKVL